MKDTSTQQTWIIAKKDLQWVINKTNDSKYQPLIDIIELLQQEPIDSAFYCTISHDTIVIAKIPYGDYERHAMRVVAERNEIQLWHYEMGEITHKKAYMRPFDVLEIADEIMRILGTFE